MKDIVGEKSLINNAKYYCVGKNPNCRFGKNIRPIICWPPPTKTTPIRMPTNNVPKLTIDNIKRGFI